MNRQFFRESRCRPLVLFLSAALPCATLLAVATASAQPPAPPSSSSAAHVVDVVALDRDGRFADDLGPADFTVTVDGARRTVLWARRVSRGPGAAAEARARQARGGPALNVGAESERTVLVVMDEASVARGDEGAMVQAAGAFLERLGLDDRIAVLRIPLAADVKVALTNERAEAQAAIAAVSGQLPEAKAIAAIDPLLAAPVEDRMTGLDPAKPVGAEPVDARLPAGDSLRSLRAVFEMLGSVPGRKIVALFSAGLPPARAGLDEAALGAVAARVAVYAFGVKAGGGTADLLSAAPLERLAVATGGAFVPLGRNTDRVVARAVRELAACYVLGLEARAEQAKGGHPSLRVQAARKGLTVRAGGWLVPLEDSAESVPPAAPAAAPDTETPRPAGASEVRPARGAGRDTELELALARLFAYADAYERQYSMLVAEEDYKQSAPGGSVRLRSDLLLVRPGANEGWASFRDVFEVDGRPVRDREERLRRLFLDARPEAAARLQAIDDESARYNTGAVERTVNVPLLPLSFLRPAARTRFDYELAGRDEADGVETLRIRYVERARPTLVGDGHGGDQPVSGTFLVDAMSGAVVETRMEARRGDSRAAIVVRYRRDPALGLWVPAEMRESYVQPGTTGGRMGVVTRPTVEGRATYSNFRRFQVTTDEKIAPPR